MYMDKKNAAIETVRSFRDKSKHELIHWNHKTLVKESTKLQKKAYHVYMFKLLDRFDRNYPEQELRETLRYEIKSSRTYIDGLRIASDDALQHFTNLSIYAFYLDYIEILEGALKKLNGVK